MKLVVALVGAGRWGANIARSLRRSAELELRAVCDPRPVEWGVPCYRDVEELFGAEAIDAVVIATPPSSHAALARRAMAAGKHVLVEKPMCTSSAEALGLWQAAGQHESRVMAGHLLLYHPAFAALRRELDGVLFGRLSISSTRWSLPGDDPTRCPWWTLGPHDIALCCALCGTPSAVSVRRGRLGLVAELRLSGGASAVLSLSATAPRKVRRFEVDTGRECYVFDDQSPQPLVVRRDRRSLPLAVSSESALDLELRHFASSLRGGTPFQSDILAGWQVVEVLEAGQRSLAHDGEWVELSPSSGAPRIGSPALRDAARCG